MDKDLKRGEHIWLIDKTPLIVLDDNGLGFNLSKPPTVGEVYLQFRAYHNYLQIKTSRHSTNYDACHKVYLDLEAWWKKTGIAIMTRVKIINKILAIHNKWKYLHKYEKK